jgi:VanZ family protein
MRKFLTYHLPLIVYAAMVLTLSSIPNLTGPKLRLVAFDKLAHFVEYAIFAFLAFRSFSRISPGIKTNFALLLSLLFLSLFALLDEIYQSFVPGRHMDPMDFLTDMFGAFLVLIFLWLRRRRLGDAQD